MYKVGLFLCSALVGFGYPCLTHAEDSALEEFKVIIDKAHQFTPKPSIYSFKHCTGRFCCVKKLDSMKGNFRKERNASEWRKHVDRQSCRFSVFGYAVGNGYRNESKYVPQYQEFGNLKVTDELFEIFQYNRKDSTESVLAYRSRNYQPLFCYTEEECLKAVDQEISHTFLIGDWNDEEKFIQTLISEGNNGKIIREFERVNGYDYPVLIRSSGRIFSENYIRDFIYPAP